MFSYALSPERTAKLNLAYSFVKDMQVKPDYYPVLAWMYMCNLPRHDYYVRKPVIEDALPFVTDDKLKKHFNHSLKYCIEYLGNMELTGFSPEAESRVDGLPLFYEMLGRDVSLHDAVMRSLVVDREKNCATMVIDTWVTWEGHPFTHHITIEFENLLQIEMNWESGNDYAWEFRGYVDNGFLVFQLDSAYVEITCEKMRILSIEKVPA